MRSRGGSAIPALAACLLLALVVGGMLLRDRLFGGPYSHIASLEVAGRQVVTASESIHVEAVEIRSGGELVLRAAGSVKIDGHLAVPEDGTLVVESGSPAGFWRSTLEQMVSWVYWVRRSEASPAAPPASE